MTSEVVEQIEAQVRELRASGRVPPGLEDELDRCFEEAAEAGLSAAGSLSAGEAARSTGAASSPLSVAELRKQVAMLARRRLGPSFRRIERRTALGAAQAGESGRIQLHVAVDRLERVMAGSKLASRVISALRPRELAGTGAGPTYPEIDGPLLSWVLERLSASAPRESPDAPCRVLHAECGDGRLVGMLAARGFDARGADPRWSVRTRGDGKIIAAGALEYLSAAPTESLDAILLTGVVDRLRPGAAQALAQLAARCLAPGGVVVLVSARPEATVAMDPVAADLAPGRPLHPVTWCHLLAHFGLFELAMFEPEASDPDANESEVFAVSARRLTPSLEAAIGGRS
jgi:SAM-dependent methyltransferase